MKLSRVNSLKKNFFSFENRLVLSYLICGALWIQFSDGILNTLIEDPLVISQIQTYKGWFYVLVTGFLFWGFLKRHLLKLRKVELELKKHKFRLQYSVKDKTRALDEVLLEIHQVNEELSRKNQLIQIKNDELEATLQKLKSTQEKLVHADKMASLGVLASGISHEINNPLNFILGGATGLENYIDEHEIQDKKLNFCLKSIKTGIDRATNIVTSMSQLSRETNKMDELCDLKTIIRNTLTLVNNQFNEGIDIEVHLDDAIGVIKGNVGQLHQVFTNLFVNAGQAMKSGGVIKVEGTMMEKVYRFKIIDSGEGIKSEDLKKVTTPFFTTKEPGKGTGLGLSITYNIIDSHKGSIHFESIYGQGTTVIVDIPIDKSLKKVS